MADGSARLVARFDGWSLYRAPLELFHGERLVRLQEQPLQILEALVRQTRRAGHPRRAASRACGRPPSSTSTPASTRRCASCAPRWSTMPRLRSTSRRCRGRAIVSSGPSRGRTRPRPRSGPHHHCRRWKVHRSRRRRRVFRPRRTCPGGAPGCRSSALRLTAALAVRPDRRRPARLAGSDAGSRPSVDSAGRPAVREPEPGSGQRLLRGRHARGGAERPRQSRPQARSHLADHDDGLSRQAGGRAWPGPGPGGHARARRQRPPRGEGRARDAAAGRRRRRPPDLVAQLPGDAGRCHDAAGAVGARGGRAARRAVAHGAGRSPAAAAPPGGLRRMAQGHSSPGRMSAAAARR